MSASRERRRFLRSFLAHPRRVGAVLPTSRRAVRDLLDMASFDDVRCVAELGAGTGVYTREIVPRLPADARLLAVELDPGLASALRDELDDPRVSVLAGSAERLCEHLDGARADVIVSGLPFTSLPGGVRQTILDEARRALAPGGTFLVLQYSPLVGADLRRRFSSVTRRLSPLNVPPAVLFACRDGADGAGA
ncbi:MAG: methyltransferase domain-containing protein [Thermoleophilaceae bacterium]|jgi:phospholipid N-methyltransferase|nr:methyltransferase domain-containing protein [Thermoleophilaceae bacterium]